MLYRTAYTTLEIIRARKDIVDTNDDTMIVNFIYQASNAIDTYCARVFEPFLQTRYYNQPSSRSLMLDEDLLSVTSVSDASGTISASDYTVYPYNTQPYFAVVLSNLGVFWESQGNPIRAVNVNGVWGYSANYARSWKVATTISQAVTTTTQTTIHITSSTSLGTLSLIKIGDEIMRVTTHGNPSIVVERGVNGSTATTHLNGETVYVWCVEDSVADTCANLTIFLYDNRDKAGADNVQVMDSSILISQQSPQRIKQALNRYTRQDWQTV